MRKKLFFLLLILFLYPSFSFAANQLLYYEPEVVKLEGMVVVQTFPGRPNYESIKKGDEVERGWYLKLDHPVNVDLLPHAEESFDEPEKNVAILQIADGNEADWKILHGGGKRVRITGTLFHSFDGHHHTRVLIDVQRLEVL